MHFWSSVLGDEHDPVLASVTGADEAEIALAHGADIIDLKDAAKGGLAPLPADVVRTAVSAVAGRRPVSAVAGEPGMDADALTSSVQKIARTGVDYVKFGVIRARSIKPACKRLRR